MREGFSPIATRPLEPTLEVHAHFTTRLFPVLTRDKRKGGHVSRVPCGPLQACPRGNCGRVCTLCAAAHGVQYVPQYRPGTVGACMHEVSIYVGRRRHGTVLASSPPQPLLQSFSQLVRPLCPSVLQSSCRIFIVSKPIQQPTNAVGNTNSSSIVQKSFAKLLVDGTGKGAGDSALRIAWRANLGTMVAQRRGVQK